MERLTRIDWELPRAESAHYEARDPRGWRFVAYLPRPDARQTHYLVPVRLIEGRGMTWAAEAGDVRRRIELETETLARKIRAVDHLALSDVVFADRFVAGRAALWVPAGPPPGDSVWEFARAAVSDLGARAGLRLVTQIDYDQKRLHTSLGSILENMAFAVRHDPSATATTTAFELALREAGVDIASARVSVTGVGDLGARIVQRLLDAGVGSLFVRDTDEERLARAAALSPVVDVVTEDEIADVRCHAHILAAYHSFSDALAERWADHDEVVAVGGPEAGLDRFLRARALLSAAGKEFIPSVLCGSLGLVSNLEETLGIAPDLSAMRRRFEAVVLQIQEHRRAHGIPFDAACEAFVTGTAVAAAR